MTRHFLTLNDLSKTELDWVIQKAIELKDHSKSDSSTTAFHGKVLGMIFEKSSTRTRISFEAGMAQLGGSAIFLSSRDTQLGRGEPIEDAARVMSRMVDMIMIRTFGHDIVERFSQHSRVPVINGLTDSFHPCQLLADLQTYTEHRGSVEGKTVAWIGDGNNMCHSYMNAAAMCGFTLNIACPKGFEPEPALLEEHKKHVNFMYDPIDAIQKANWVVTDVWASMGQEKEQTQRLASFKNYQVNHTLLKQASSDVVFMHCLPAHRGEEVSTELLEDTDISVVWDEAENRLHAQKALMLLLGGHGY